MSDAFGLSVFRYPESPHVRRHGPSGYFDYTSYKPWLRDEFCFRCVFCLDRERWSKDGADRFGVDHFLPKSATPVDLCMYENLFYVCNRCNAAKGICLVSNPCKVAFGKHLMIQGDGRCRGLTKEGECLIDSFNLNHAKVVEYRRRKIEQVDRWHQRGDRLSIIGELGFPDDMPDLATRKCSNSIPNSHETSWYAKKCRGELPATY